MGERGEGRREGEVSEIEVVYGVDPLVLLHHISLSHLLPTLSVKYLLRWKVGQWGGESLLPILLSPLL